MWIELNDYLAQQRQYLRDAFDYARPAGSREPTEADLDRFVELAHDWWRKSVSEISQDQQDEIVDFILFPERHED